MRTISTSNTPTTSFSPTSSLTGSLRSPWHSPVPYLFGGLAAMLGLIAFALLILACSYWKLSSQLQSEGGGDRDLESGKEGESAKKESVKDYEEKILVIMAGEEKPTFLATAKSLSFGDGLGKDDSKELGNYENCEKSEKDMETHVEANSRRGNEDNHETQQQNQ